MREIKFRQPIFNSKGTFIKYHYWGFIDGVFVNNSGYLNADMQDYILIQERYTWLKDKNWVEIYEGDIVKWGNAVWVVEWITSIAWFNIQNETHEYSEVIWNIYENPNLLKP